VTGLSYDNLKRAMTIIDTIVHDPEPGAIYNGKVTRLMDFGAFVEIAPGKEGLVHISQLDVKHTDKVTDVVKVGDIVMVKVLGTDDRGRLNLSRREALIEVEGLVPENNLSEEQQNRRPPRRDDHRPGRPGGRPFHREHE
jgi:polyribonucleotide nucleotidyltransferase